jgi:HEPN domain-containing protein
MKPHLEEAALMLRMADRDIAAFNVLSRAEDIHPTIICFHAQQAVEKCLKAVLFGHRIEFRRTHDLDLLSALLAQHEVSLPLTSDQLAALSPCAVIVRYDDVEIEIAGLDGQSLHEMITAARRWAEENLHQLS